MIHLKEVTDLRPKYAALLREIADRIEHQPMSPVAFFGFLFWPNGDVNSIQEREAGINVLAAAGYFHRVSIEFALEVNKVILNVPKTQKDEKPEPPQGG